jgi:hypothetical protein
LAANVTIIMLYVTRFVAGQPPGTPPQTSGRHARRATRGGRLHDEVKRAAVERSLHVYDRLQHTAIACPRATSAASAVPQKLRV